MQAANGASSGDVRREHLLDAGFADGDQRKLGSYKKGVGQDEHGHGDKFEQRKAVHLGERIAPSGTGARGSLPVAGYLSPISSGIWERAQPGKRTALKWAQALRLAFPRPETHTAVRKRTRRVRNGERLLLWPN